MFGSLFTPRHRTAALFPDGMDRHTHILWGVDDGASTPQESLAIIRTLKSLGFSGAYCTPHIKASCPGAVVKPGLSIHGGSAASSEKQAAAWAKKSI